MSRFFGRWVSLAIACAVVVWLIPGITVIGDNTALAIIVFAAFLALINATIRPVLHILTLPVTILTLGFSALAVNIVCMNMASQLALHTFHTGITITDHTTAFLASIVLSIVSGFVNKLIW